MSSSCLEPTVWNLSVPSIDETGDARGFIHKTAGRLPPILSTRGSAVARGSKQAAGSDVAGFGRALRASSPRCRHSAGLPSPLVIDDVDCFRCWHPSLPVAGLLLPRAAQTAAPPPAAPGLRDQRTAMRLDDGAADVQAQAHAAALAGDEGFELLGHQWLRQPGTGVAGQSGVLARHAARLVPGSVGRTGGLRLPWRSRPTVEQRAPSR